MAEALHVESRLTPDSSNIEEIRYVGYDKFLIITFKNKSMYGYFGVPTEVWLELEAAESAGKAFHALIRNKFNFVRLL